MERPTTWLVIANLIFLAGGIFAYYSTTSLGIMAALSLVAALPALWELKIKPAALWFDRAASAAAGTWAVVAILIILPYITIEEGRSLWASTAFAALALAVASLGTMLWNALALLGQGVEMSKVRSFAIFHVAAVAAAIYMVVQGDGEAMQVIVRDVEVTAHDLQLAPALAAAPAMVWVVAWITSPQSTSE